MWKICRDEIVVFVCSHCQLKAFFFLMLDSAKVKGTEPF